MGFDAGNACRGAGSTKGSCLMTHPLPMIPRKHVRSNGSVEFWDMLAEDGPVKLERTSILAREAMQRDPERYRLELPRNIKPGPAQIEAERRAAEAAAEDEDPPDPVYGKRRQQ